MKEGHKTLFVHNLRRLGAKRGIHTSVIFGSLVQVLLREEFAEHFFFVEVPFLLSGAEVSIGPNNLAIQRTLPTPRSVIRRFDPLYRGRTFQKCQRPSPGKSAHDPSRHCLRTTDV